MTDAGSLERTYTLSATKLGDLLKLISSAGLGCIQPQQRDKAIHLESIRSDSQSTLEEG